jgi:pantoate kinase
MKKVSAFSPSHITGIFTIHNEYGDPLKSGSRGAGLSIKSGTITRVYCKRSAKNRVFIRINGRYATAETSRYVVDWYLKKIRDNVELFVEHKIHPPIGSGFGTSGGGALSLSLALNELFGLGLSDVEAAQIAHLAEIENRTGLGTVIAEFYGGFEIRLKPGAPGIGRILRVRVSDDLRVVALCLGRISTKKVLSDNNLVLKINKYGDMFLKKLMMKPDINNFLFYSKAFSYKVGLISDRLNRIISRLNEAGFISSMAMVGSTVFTVVNEDSVNDVKDLFSSFCRNEDEIIVSPIDNYGARLI